jgi:glycolate oxidase
VSSALKADLIRLLGIQGLVDEPERCAAYGGDYSGLQERIPQLVLRPQNTREASDLIAYLYRVGKPMTLRGAGTGKAGGCIPSEGSVVVSTERMQSPLNVAPQDLTVCAPAGTVAANLDQAASECGLYYPPDPNSLAISSIGGNVATNAGGPKAVKYGLTGHYLLGLTLVGAEGAVVQAGAGTIKCVAGSNLTGLMLGSEGTFGLITEVTMRLVARPTTVQTALVTFESSSAAVAAVGRLFATGVMPRCAELLDEVSCETIATQHRNALPKGCRAALILETDGSEEQSMDDLSTLANACEGEGEVQVFLAQSEADKERVWAPRRDLSLALGQRRNLKVSEDIAVPRGRLSEALDELRMAAEKTPFEVATYGHAGDGNLHVNILFDDETQRGDVEQLQDQVFRIAIGLGGTITGEHGVGLAKRHALPWELSEARMAVEHKLKSAMDPSLLFNPGKVLPA